MDSYDSLYSGIDPVYLDADDEAVDEGILVALDNIFDLKCLPFTPSGLRVNRVTSSVFETFAVPEPEFYTINARKGRIEPAYDPGPVLEAINDALAHSREEDGWYIGSHKGRELWIVPNDIGGATVMFPEDY